MNLRSAGTGKIQVPNAQGLSYDLTLYFNTIKERKAGDKFKKQRKNIENIVSSNMEPLLMFNTYEIEDKLAELCRIRDKMKGCRELYEKKVFENQKVHLKVEELNSEAFQLISQIEDDLIRMKTQAPKNESATQTEGRKNMRTNFSLRLHDVSKEIRDINVDFLIKSGKYKEIEQSDWYHKMGLDKEMGDLIADKILDEEKEIENIAKRRDDDITHIALSVEKISGQFKQLHNLVIEQGTILDRIDYNIEKATDNTNKAKKTLASAHERKTNSSTLARKVIFIQTVLIIIFCILLILKYRKRQHK